MSGQSINRHQANKIVHFIKTSLSFTLQKIFPQCTNLLKCLWVIKHKQVLRKQHETLKIDFAQPRLDRLQGGREKSRPSEHHTQRIQIATVRNSSHQGSLKESRSTAHKRIVDGITGPCHPFDKETRNLRFETGPKGDFVNTMGRPLP